MGVCVIMMTSSRSYLPNFVKSKLFGSFCKNVTLILRKCFGFVSQNSLTRNVENGKKHESLDS